ncbi:hypothetical protein K505DRAFT_409018 [Melanomma pulvis-pyrius CBS 109.77]|uniref:G-patch domain-containing protein n=1 Tax=Melanomma pulvis-pyrius CBS 109.77 TaxID=1314802 RepID=A0A6A6X6R3_9PLEO|nr:hypothetical protein K505DRAFT_409018 [Melanomma pulvis-pyrius CBS 109.77]
MTGEGGLQSVPNSNRDDDDDDDDDDGISTKPFVDQPAYGRGLWRFPINFVPASSEPPPAPATPTVDPNSIVAKYLAIVFPNGRPPPAPKSTLPICEICGTTIDENDPRPHILSAVHQISVPRVPPPSSIDRSRMGLRYMEKHGFDVDARKGLGSTSQGILFPIVPKEKQNTHGLGFQVKKGVVEKKAIVKLDAGKVRKMAEAEKKKDAELRKMFYGDDKVEKYLGGLGG